MPSRGRCCRFINEADGSQTAFLDGNQPDRLCAPIVQHVEARGGRVLTGCPVSAIETADSGEVTGLRLADGSVVEADTYISAMPVDVLKRLVPAKWSTMPYFTQVDGTACLAASGSVTVACRCAGGCVSGAPWGVGHATAPP